MGGLSHAKRNYPGVHYVASQARVLAFLRCDLLCLPYHVNYLISFGYPVNNRYDGKRDRRGFIVSVGTRNYRNSFFRSDDCPLLCLDSCVLGTSPQFNSIPEFPVYSDGSFCSGCFTGCTRPRLWSVLSCRACLCQEQTAGSEDRLSLRDLCQHDSAAKRNRTTHCRVVLQNVRHQLHVCRSLPAIDHRHPDYADTWPRSAR